LVSANKLQLLHSASRLLLRLGNQRPLALDRLQPLDRLPVPDSGNSLQLVVLVRPLQLSEHQDSVRRLRLLLASKHRLDLVKLLPLPSVRRPPAGSVSRPVRCRLDKLLPHLDRLQAPRLDKPLLHLDSQLPPVLDKPRPLVSQQVLDLDSLRREGLVRLRLPPLVRLGSAKPRLLRSVKPLQRSALLPLLQVDYHLVVLVVLEARRLVASARRL
jgi:hypothetical protein